MSPFFALSRTGKTTLSAELAMYHFLSGYTSRVAATEKGLGVIAERVKRGVHEMGGFPLGREG